MVNEILLAGKASSCNNLGKDVFFLQIKTHSTCFVSVLYNTEE